MAQKLLERPQPKPSAHKSASGKAPAGLSEGAKRRFSGYAVAKSEQSRLVRVYRVKKSAEPASPAPPVAPRIMAEAASLAAKRKGPVAVRVVELADLLPDKRSQAVYFDTFGANSAAHFVRSARQQAGLTQQALAKRLGVSQSRVAELETASRQGPTLGMLNRVAAACGRRLRLVLE